MTEYSLCNGLIEADTPKEVGHNKDHFWFPSLHHVGKDTLVCAVVRSADLAQGKWPAELFVSADCGSSWDLDQGVDSYGHTSIRHNPSRTLMMPYELWPTAPGHKLDSVASGHLFTVVPDGGFVVEPRDIRFCDFPFPLAPYHEDELFLLHTGNILQLPSGQLFTTLYGKFEGDEKFSSLAVVSNDGGFTWSYRSTIAGTDAAPDALEGPNESDTQLLDNGDLLCVFRVNSGSEFYKCYSWDEGLTWSESMRMGNMWSVQPRLAKLGNGPIVLTGGRPGLFFWFNFDGRGEDWEQVNLGAHHNRAIEDSACHFSEAFCRAAKDEDPALSTSYTGIMPWGEDQVVVTYDRLANGWSGAPGPNGDVDRVFSITLKVSI